MGGGEWSALGSYSNYVRAGGFLTDALRYLKGFDHPYKMSKILKSSKYYADKIFNYRRFKICRFDDLQDELKVNCDSSPGPTYKLLGVKKKGEAVNLAFSSAEAMMVEMERTKQPLQYDILWGLSARAKLTTIGKAFSKIVKGESAGRAIIYGDFEESILGQMYTNSIMRALSGNANIDNIMIGFNRLKNNLALKEWVESTSYIVMLDYSKFDRRMPPCVISKAFAVLAEVLNLEDEDLVYTHCLLFLCRQFIYSNVDLGNGIVIQKNGGIPSGSIFTSLIGSICNYIMLNECHLEMGIKEDEYSFKVYGDDGLIGYESKECKVYRRKKDLIATMKSKFGMTLKQSDTKVCLQKFVRYGIPIYNESVKRGTSHLKPIDFKICKDEPRGYFWTFGSHRWQYLFKGTWSFLQYSMLEDGRMIRPAFDSFNRLYNPERRVRTLDEHISLLKVVVLENIHNSHVLNRCMHYLYDAFWLYIRGYHTPNQVYKVTSGSFRPAHDKVEEEDVRMWYRKTDKYVDMFSDPRLHIFATWWEYFKTKLYQWLLGRTINILDIWKYKRRGYRTTVFNEEYMTGVKVNGLKKLKAMGLFGKVIIRKGLLDQEVNVHDWYEDLFQKCLDNRKIVNRTQYDWKEILKLRDHNNAIFHRYQAIEDSLVKNKVYLNSDFEKMRRGRAYGYDRDEDFILNFI
jgi:hypothetical protein